MASQQHTTLYDTQALTRVLDSMALHLANRLTGAAAITLVGVRRRGAPLADALLTRLRPRLPGMTIDRLDLLIKRYSDDLALLHPETQLTFSAWLVVSTPARLRLLPSVITVGVTWGWAKTMVTSSSRAIIRSRLQSSGAMQ